MSDQVNSTQSGERTEVRLTLNGQSVSINARPLERLSTVLRDTIGLIGTKVGCDAGDCGACTVTLDDQQVCACMVPIAQVAGRSVDTIEGIGADPKNAELMGAFQRHGAAQCGICTPAMVIAASTLLRESTTLDEAAVERGLSGVLCRCTGYRAIVAAVLDVANSRGKTSATQGTPQLAVGARVEAIDAELKVSGTARFGADQQPTDSLAMLVVRSPHPHARFTFGALDSFCAAHPGIRRILTAIDVPGLNGFGIYPDLKDQPVLAPGIARFRGEAVAAIIGTAEAVARVSVSDLPINWEVLEAVLTPAKALQSPPINPTRPDNVLTTGRLRGVTDAPAAALDADTIVRAGGAFTTAFVEHAYIEPEAGYAVPLGNGRIEVYATTQTPYMDREEVANVLGVEQAQVRIRPSACGGGFGGKLDQSVQPLVALAAWLLDAPVRTVYTRTESMASSTKRHPSTIEASATADTNGALKSYYFRGDFNTGAYASWGPTVAGRVPVHCMGPYRVRDVDAEARAIFTNGPPSGAFRGFGVPQAALAHETLMDELAELCAIDPLEFRHRNALRAGDTTASGHLLEASVGLAECLDALRPRWDAARREAQAFNESAHDASPLRKGVGVGCMWYGCGNTAMSNPSTMRIVLGRDGTLTYYNGAQDIGQGAATVMTQIVADALGAPMSELRVVGADTDLTEDAGKSSASRQTFVSGKAAELAGLDLRAQLLRLADAGDGATIKFAEAMVTIVEGERSHRIDLGSLDAADDPQAGAVLVGRGYFDPPTTSLDENGQGVPYATYGFAAQIAEIEVDVQLGTIKVAHITAAHDVGKAVNPTMVEGQIHGGVAQGIGLALMEEYIPGRTENLHDYLIPTVGDVPPIDCIIVEDPEPLGPFGAKGIGEPALIPTAPAIANALYHATGVRVRDLPLLPHRVREALQNAGRSD